MTEGWRVPSGTAVIQRDLAAVTIGYGGDEVKIGEALAPLIKAKKVKVTASGDKTLYGSLLPETRPEAERALEGAGFSHAKEMADAVYNRHNVILFTGGVPDPMYGGARVGGASREDSLERQSSRPLTTYEINEAGKVFWGSLHTDSVEISESRIWTLGGYARTMPNHVRFPRGSFDKSDFIPWLIHELTHVWQYQHGAPIGNVVISALRGNYDYGEEAALRQRWADGDSFVDFGFEQQGDILEDYYNKLVSGADVSAYEPFVQQVRSGVWQYRLPPAKTVEPLPSATLDVPASNKKYQAGVEHEIIAQLRLRIDRADRAAIIKRHDEVLALFHKVAGYWSAEYLKRIDARRSGDVLISLLYRRMSDETVAQVRRIFGGN